MYNIVDYGAVGDGKTLNTACIQGAIDDCCKNGGGRVFIPVGKFVSGTIWLKDNVELHLEHGAILKASTDMNDYNAEDAYPQNYGVPQEGWTGKHFIIANEVRNVAITGTGIIDGSGDYFFGEPRLDYSWMTGYGWRDGFAAGKIMRPGQMVCFIESERILIENITFQNSPCWNCFVYGCEYVNISGVKIFNSRTSAQTDGIDIDCSCHVVVSNCNINTGDDCITVRCDSKHLKRYKRCEYITVSNCIFRSQACGMRFGVGRGEICHVLVRGIIVVDTGYAFLFQTKYGSLCKGFLDDISVSDVSCDDVSSAFRMIAPTGSITRTSISNVRSNCIANVRIVASGDGLIKDISVRNVDLYLKPEPDDVIFDEKRFDARGREVVCVENTENVVLDGVRVFADDLTLSKWHDVYAERNNKNLLVKNCKF